VPLVTTDPDGKAKIKDISLEPIPVIAEIETLRESPPLFLAEDNI
jgi:hypothetical protein